MNRIEALTAVLQDPGRSQAEKVIAARALRAGVTDDDREPETTASPYQQLSQDSMTMLSALGKKHLREISEEEFARYALHFDPSFKEKLCRQWREWVCPNDAFLVLIGMSRAGYWKTIYDHAKSEDVRMNPVAEMRKRE